MSDTLKQQKIWLAALKSTALLSYYYILYGKMGRLPLKIAIYKRMIRYWCNMLLHPNRNKINILLYQQLLYCYNYGTIKSVWISKLKHILDNTHRPVSIGLARKHEPFQKMTVVSDLCSISKNIYCWSLKFIYQS